jgi:hypothetical protein
MTAKDLNVDGAVAADANLEVTLGLLVLAELRRTDPERAMAIATASGKAHDLEVQRRRKAA